MEDRQVENDQWQLECHAKTNHQQNLDVDIVLKIRKDRGNGIGLSQQPLKARRNNDEVAKDRADEEQRRGGKNSGNNPTTLIGFERRQEKAQNLPDDHRRTHDHSDLDGDRESQGKAAE